MHVDGPLILVGLVATLAGLTAAGRLLRGDESRGRRRCGRCWYDMSRIGGLRCPECGHKARREGDLFRTRRRWRRINALVALSAAGVLAIIAGSIGWPQLVPAAVWRAALPYLDPGAERHLATVGVPMMPMSGRMSRWERLRYAYRCSLVLDGAACPAPAPPRTASKDALFGLMALSGEARIALPIVERVFHDRSAPTDERELALLVLMDYRPLAGSAAMTEQIVFEDPDGAVRRAAARHLLRIGKEQPQIVPVLTRLLRAGDPQIRHDVAAGLGEFGAPASAALPELDRLAARDPDAEVRDRALGAAILIRADVDARASAAARRRTTR